MMTAVAVVLALLFLLSGATKVFPNPTSLATREKFSVPATAWNLLGAAEIAGAAVVLLGLSVAPLGIASSIGLVLVGIGALAAQERARGGLLHAAPAVVALALATTALILFST